MSSSNATMKKSSRGIVFVLLLGVAFSILWPLWLIGTAALRTNEDYLRNPFGLPSDFTFENFFRLLDTYGIGQAFLNSLMVVMIAMVIQLSIATFAGYALAKYPVPGSKLIIGSFVAVMLIPGQVLIIPIYLLLSKFGLVGEFPGLIIVYVATGLPFCVFFLALSFRGVPNEVMEAAKIDGAGFFRTFFSVVLPMGVSGVATVAVLQFLGMWNELIFAFILLPDDSKTLLTPALAEIGGKFVRDQTLVSAGLLVTAAVPILLLIVASKYIMQGLSAGFSR